MRKNARSRLAAVAASGLVAAGLALAWWLRPFPAPEPGRAVASFGPDEPGAATTTVEVYANDFQGVPYAGFPGWSSSAISFENRFGLPVSGKLDAPPIAVVQAPKTGRWFLGEFGGPRLDPTARTRVRQAARLKLDDLPKHTKATVAFDLLILKSWDGNSPRYGPDRWSLKVEGGPTLLDSTFSNNPKVEAEGSDQDYPKPASKPRSGAASAGTLGYNFFGDSIYRLSFTFPHQARKLALEFAGDLFEGKGEPDESWGLDNVSVKVDRPK